MFQRFIPQETKFFDLFEQQAVIIVQSAQVFHSLVLDIAQLEAYAERIKELELQADQITHQCMETLHKTFITPFDRYDIQHLTCSLDDIIDEIDAAADCLVVYKVTEIYPFTKELAEVLLASVHSINAAVVALRNLSQSEEIRNICFKINKLENDADVFLRNAVGKLFENESDIRTLIKWKEIYEHLEIGTDHCNKVANIIEGIVLEYA